MKFSHLSPVLLAVALVGCKSNAPTAPTAPATVEKAAPEIAVQSAAAPTMAPTSAPTMAPTPAMTMASAAKGTKPYQVRGQVVSLPAPVGGSALVEIKHEDIPGFMPAMTMRMPLQNAADGAKLKPGDKVSFSMNPDNTQVFNIQKLPASTALKLAK